VTGHFYFRGGAVAITSDRVSQAASAHREIRQYPGSHGNAFTIADGLSDAQLLRLSHHGYEPIEVTATDHYRLMREFCADPSTFIDSVLAD
jgi:hypothetical protein